MSFSYARLGYRLVPPAFHKLANLAHNIFSELLAVGDNHELERGIQGQRKGREADGADKRLEMPAGKIDQKLFDTALQELLEIPDNQVNVELRIT